MPWVAPGVFVPSLPFPLAGRSLTHRIHRSMAPHKERRKRRPGSPAPSGLGSGRPTPRQNLLSHLTSHVCARSLLWICGAPENAQLPLHVLFNIGLNASQAAELHDCRNVTDFPQSNPMSVLRGLSEPMIKGGPAFCLITCDYLAS